MKLEELGEIELRRLQNLRLVDVDVLEGVDGTSGLLDLTSNCFRDELGNQFLKVNG